MARAYAAEGGSVKLARPRGLVSLGLVIIDPTEAPVLLRQLGATSTRAHGPPARPSKEQRT